MISEMSKAFTAAALCFAISSALAQPPEATGRGAEERGAAAAAAMGRNYGRSMVISQQGIVASSQVLASQAGAQILARGGSAVDAAIASNAVLAVTEPLMDGIGGDLFVLYWDAK